METEDELCQGQPRVVNEDLINVVWALTKENGCISVAEIKWYFQDMAHRTAIKIIQDGHGVRQICARWVPKLLDHGQKWNRVTTNLDFIYYHHAKEEDLFDWIVTVDEKCNEAMSSEKW